MSFVPATSNRDLWVVLGAMITGALLLVWIALRGNGDSNNFENGDTDAHDAT
ncbi:MAG TPA: hypothetical protein VL123_01435 [Candidatus Udaeobacter sp.]|jgi:hypothetical protein|nr:hypothetical protein [Candidatus Udaeobacter sp.]